MLLITSIFQTRPYSTRSMSGVALQACLKCAAYSICVFDMFIHAYNSRSMRMVSQVPHAAALLAFRRSEFVVRLANV